MDVQPMSTSQRILYLEPFSGVSGDMMLGALVDLGADFELLKQQLGLLPLQGYHLTLQKVMRAGIYSTKIDVHIEGEPEEGHGHSHHGHGHGHHHHPHRNLRDIEGIIGLSALSAWVKSKSLDAFRRLAEAEGRVHNQPPEQVHFHEVGAVDSIVDIVGSMIALEGFLPARIICAPVNVGHGTLKCQHGIYPVPGPATQELLKGIPTYSDEISGELTTPTGAALLATLVDAFDNRPLMKMQASGFGAGSRDNRHSANVFRITQGDAILKSKGDSTDQRVAVIEAAIDDMSPQIYGYFQEKAFSAGALDAYAAAITMKKNRPAILLTVVCAVSQVEAMSSLIFSETTTIGLRYVLAERKILPREIVTVKTEFGDVALKVVTKEGGGTGVAPEFEDCRRLALECNVPLRDVFAAAEQAYRKSVAEAGENRA
jgi:pyridinium-3,5-bisthiocarboxylic acid mononucleotide nickel chelatase